MQHDTLYICDGPQAFKGTPHVGTSDFKTEAPLLDALDEAFYELQVRLIPKATATTSLLNMQATSNPGRRVL